MYRHPCLKNPLYKRNPLYKEYLLFFLFLSNLAVRGGQKTDILVKAANFSQTGGIVLVIKYVDNT